MTAARIEEKMALRLLSLLLAVLVFLFVFSETEGETTVSVPVEYFNLPPGMIAEPPPPAVVPMVLVGPRILLAKAKLSGIVLRLDLKQAHRGVNRVDDLERFARLDQQVRAKPVSPSLEINLRQKD